VAEERRFGQWHERARDGCQEEHGVDKRVLVIGGHDEGAALRHLPRANHLHATVEDGEERAREGADKSSAEGRA
jgi:hypothetical protein